MDVDEVGVECSFRIFSIHCVSVLSTCSKEFWCNPGFHPATLENGCHFYVFWTLGIRWGFKKFQAIIQGVQGEIQRNLLHLLFFFEFLHDDFFWDLRSDRSCFDVFNRKKIRFVSIHFLNLQVYGMQHST